MLMVWCAQSVGMGGPGSLAVGEVRPVGVLGSVGYGRTSARRYASPGSVGYEPPIPTP